MKSLAEELRAVLEQDERVRLLYLYGSRASSRESTVSDIDIAVLVKGGLDTILDLIRKLARSFKVPEERIDIVDLDRVPLVLKYEVLRSGIKLIDRGRYGENIAKDVLENYPAINEDFSITSRLWLKEDPELNVRLLLRRLDEVLRNASMIRERYLGKDISWLLGDPERTYAFERALHRAIEAALDACRHVVSANRLGLAEYYSDYPLRIAEANLMNRNLAEKISELARLRNLQIHQYADLDYQKLMEKAEELAKDVAPSFAEWLRSLVKRA